MAAGYSDYDVNKWDVTDTGIVASSDPPAQYGTFMATNNTFFTQPTQQFPSYTASYPTVPTYQPSFEPPQYEQPIVPLFADATTVRAALQRQLRVLESLQDDGHAGPMAEYLADAVFFLKETMEALEKI